MYIVAIAWIYVVFMMAITEPTVIAGIMTFLSYCVLPLVIFLYVFRGSRRKKPLNIRKPAAEQSITETNTSPATVTPPHTTEIQERQASITQTTSTTSLSKSG